MASLEADRENWEQARVFLLDAKRLGNTDNVQKLLAEVSKNLTVKYTSREEKLPPEEIIHLGWCFFDAKMAQDGAAFFAGHPEYRSAESSGER